MELGVLACGSKCAVCTWHCGLALLGAFKNIYIYTYNFFKDLCTRHNFCSLNSQYVRHVAKEQRDYKKEAEKSSSLTF